VIVDPQLSAYYTLDGVGLRLWDLIQEPRHVGDICERLLEEFDVPADLLLRDVMVLLGELYEAELIEILDEP
jgi:hypothetical protein